jgi:hypothetical protein
VVVVEVETMMGVVVLLSLLPQTKFELCHITPSKSFPRHDGGPNKACATNRGTCTTPSKR